MCHVECAQVDVAGLDAQMVALARKKKSLQAALDRQQDLSQHLTQVSSVSTCCAHCSYGPGSKPCFLLTTAVYTSLFVPNGGSTTNMSHHTCFQSAAYNAAVSLATLCSNTRKVALTASLQVMHILKSFHDPADLLS